MTFAARSTIDRIVRITVETNMLTGTYPFTPDDISELLLNLFSRRRSNRAGPVSWVSRKSAPEHTLILSLIWLPPLHRNTPHLLYLRKCSSI